MPVFVTEKKEGKGRGIESTTVALLRKARLSETDLQANPADSDIACGHRNTVLQEVITKGASLLPEMEMRLFTASQRNKTSPSTGNNDPLKRIYVESLPSVPNSALLVRKTTGWGDH